MKPETSHPLRVGMISLGCAKNLVDAEIMLGSLLQAGVEITNDPKQADVLIVNTCSFIDAAQEESVDTILQSAELREAAHPDQGLVVSGCLPQRFRDELPKLLPEVDAFMGIDQVARVGDIVKDAFHRRQQRRNEPHATKATRANIAKHLNQSPNQGRAKPPAEPHDPSENIRPNPALPNRGSGRAATAVVAPAPSQPIFDVAARPTYIPDYATPRFRLTPAHFAYVKIAEGCNHPCSFCIIPRMRGSHRSRALQDVVREARQLLDEGVKELNLISQDTTYYGLDLRPARLGSIAAPDKFNAAAKALPADAPTLCSLLRELNALPGDFWIRLLYTHPAHWTDELIQTIAACPKVARYVDMPLQHIHDVMLERMRRETSSQYIRDLIQKIRAGIPGIALRTTFIVGFPGETEASFEALLDFIRGTKFERVGIFTYSREDGTRAGKMAQQVPDKIKQRRRALAMSAQHEVAVGVSQQFVGRTLKVLIEQEANARELKKANVLSWEHGLLRAADEKHSSLRGQYLVARSEADAPDIDGRVYVRAKLPSSQFATVRVVGHTDYDLIAEPV
jgi:ribosomal protein S12 methylthiotransferase